MTLDSSSLRAVQMGQATCRGRDINQSWVTFTPVLLRGAQRSIPPHVGPGSSLRWPSRLSLLQLHTDLDPEMAQVHGINQAGYA
jgi:hypothetical protein